MSQMDRRRVLKALGALGVAGFAGACGWGGDDETAGQPIKIGLITPQNGGHKPVGDEMSNGFRLFLDGQNQLLGGRPVELVTADEGENPKAAREAVERLLQQNVHALTGIAGAAALSAVRDTVEQARVPLIASNASAPSLQSVVYIWRTSYVLDEPSRAIAPYVARQLPSNGRVVIVAPEDMRTMGIAEGFREGFGVGDSRLSGTVVWTTAALEPNRNAYRGAISNALQQRPDAIYCYFSGTAAVQFVKQLRAAGYTKAVYGPGFLTEGSVLDELRERESAGIKTALNYSTDLNNAANRRFVSSFRKAYNTSPTTYAMASYDAAQVLDKAVRLAGPASDPQQINLALGRIGQIDSPRGSWQFNQVRTPQQKWYLRNVQRDGRVHANVLVNELAALG